MVKTGKRRTPKMKDIKETRRVNANRIIKELYGEIPGSQSKFATLLGTQPNLVSRYLSGKKPIGDRMARKMEKVAGKAKNWMDQHQGAIVTDMGNDVTLLPNTKEGEPIRLYAPLLSWQEAADLEKLVAKGASMVAEARVGYPCPVPAGSGTFTLRVHGVSMEPDFHDGELIFVDPALEVQHRRFVIAKTRTGNEAILRRYITEAGKAYLKTSNPSWPEAILEVDESVAIVGVVFYKGSPV